MSQAQTTIDEFIIKLDEKIETVGNTIEDKIALLYGEAGELSQRLDILMLQFKQFLGHFNQKIDEIKKEFKDLREGLHER